MLPWNQVAYIRSLDRKIPKMAIYIVGVLIFAFAVKANACITVYNCAAVVVRFLRKTVVYGLSVHIVT